MYLFLLLVGVPLLEIFLFIEVGGWIGVWPTILLVIVTAIVGASMLRAQGVAALRQLQTEIERGGDPSPLIVHGAMLLFAGALLLTPGFFTDAVGFTLLVPQARQKIIEWAKPYVVGRIVTVASRHRGQARRAPPGASPGASPGDQPIEADYEVVDDEDPRPRR
jgi:UPF0716 protein FxsA